MAYTTINKSTDYQNTKLYTGTAGGQTISGVGHQPDFIWVKQRGDAGYDHSLHNSVSGFLKQLISNSTTAEITNTDTITSNNSDGFVLGADTAGPNANSNNQDTKNYVSWNWKAGGTGSSNTDGSITSTVSVNTTSGFSIVKFTGTEANGTVGHGLGVAPKFIFGKNLDTGTSAWPVYHASIGGTKYLNINTTSGEGTYGGYWNNTAPTSNVFSVGSHADVNRDNMIYYCFAEKPGYSKIGSYTGNGNEDGPFTYTGFKPAFTLVKRIDSNNDWNIQDTARQIYNGQDGVVLQANESKSESDIGNGFARDSLSNGFKIKNTGTETNASGGTYIYMAFGQSIVGSNNVPATAR
jgi:hypothetical protein